MNQLTQIEAEAIAAEVDLRLLICLEGAKNVKNPGSRGATDFWEDDKGYIRYGKKPDGKKGRQLTQKDFDHIARNPEGKRTKTSLQKMKENPSAADEKEATDRGVAPEDVQDEREGRSPKDILDDLDRKAEEAKKAPETRPDRIDVRAIAEFADANTKQADTEGSWYANTDPDFEKTAEEILKSNDPDYAELREDVKGILDREGEVDVDIIDDLQTNLYLGAARKQEREVFAEIKKKYGKFGKEPVTKAFEQYRDEMREEYGESAFGQPEFDDTKGIVDDFGVYLKHVPELGQTLGVKPAKSNEGTGLPTRVTSIKPDGTKTDLSNEWDAYKKGKLSPKAQEQKDFYEQWRKDTSRSSSKKPKTVTPLGYPSEFKLPKK